MKQTQSRFIVNKHLPKICMVVQKKPRKLKIQKKSAENLIKNTKNLFRRKKENEAIKEKTIRLFLSKKKIIRNQ